MTWLPRAEYINKKLWFPHDGDVELWVRWVIERPCDFTGSRRSDYIWKKRESLPVDTDNYCGIPLNFKTCDEFRDYLRNHLGFEDADKIKDMDEYPIFMPEYIVIGGSLDLSKRDKILYAGLLSMAQREVKVSRSNKFFYTSIRFWCWDKCKVIAEYCPQSLSNAVITIG